MVLKRRLPTIWKYRGLNPSQGQIFRPVQTGPKDHPAYCAMGTEIFLGAKRPAPGATTLFHLMPGREWSELHFYPYIINVTIPDTHTHTHIYIYI
jgi:hypothetical protein